MADVQKSLRIIGVPLDHGAGRRGVGMGPSAIRIAGLHRRIERLGWAFEDSGDLHIPAPETRVSGDAHARFLPIVLQACRDLADEVERALDDDVFPLVIGGDHSIAIGSISGVAAHVRKTKGVNAQPRVGVIWFDAHADINSPETSPSGNIHGMPVACLLGTGPAELCNLGFEGAKLDPSRVVQIGLRDIDEQEKRLVKASGIHAYTMEDIDKRGMPAIIKEAIEITTKDSDHLHVSFDIDGLDPGIAPGTGTPVLGGLTYREAHLALEQIAATGLLRSLDMVEVNPVLDIRNQTSEVAVGMIASALGSRIL